MSEEVNLYTIREDVICLKCGNKGAVQSYGQYYPKGVGKLADEIKAYESVRNKPYMAHTYGFGGTLPHRCLNCGNIGLIDFGGLEGFQQAFQTIGEPQEQRQPSLLQRRVRRLFEKYTKKHHLTLSEATGKVLYELENTFEKSPTAEEVVITELVQLNKGNEEVISYLIKRKSGLLRK